MPTVSLLKKILIALCVFAVLLAVLVAYLVMRSSSLNDAQSDSSEEVVFVRPDMENLMPLIFNPQSEVVQYDWALSQNDEGKEQLTETSRIEIDGQTYDFLLATLKENEVDEDFSVIDYFTLTITATNDAGSEDELVFVDLEGNGDLDSVYLNNVMQTSPQSVRDAKNQYILELFVARDHVLGY
jgi:hypothetical protein